MTGCLTANRGKTRAGFTLLEMLIAMGMASILLAGVVLLYSSSNRSYIRQDQMIGAEQNVRSAMEIMSHEIRMAGYIPLEYLPGAAKELTADVSGESWSDGKIDRIEEATAATIAFVTDLNSDGVPETVRYTLTGNTITRQHWEWRDGSGSWVSLVGAGVGTVTMAENVTGMAFSYSFENGVVGIPNNADGSTENDREDIRAVTIAITGQTRTQVVAGQFGYRTLRSYVRMRNMGLETSTH